MAAETWTPTLAILSSLLLLLLLLLLHMSPLSPSAAADEAGPDPPPTPAPWPHQFHAVLFRNHTGSLALIDLWYDWPNGRNFNIIQDQLGRLLYDLEWDNGTSFVYTLDASRRCRTLHFDVGILRPSWLDGAQYLGRDRVDGFLCNVWQKADFIRYYEDVATRGPVHWVFYTGRSVHAMTFEVGAAMEDAKWQAPVYCFEKEESEHGPEAQVDIGEDLRENLMLQSGALIGGAFGGFSM